MRLRLRLKGETHRRRNVIGMYSCVVGGVGDDSPIGKREYAGEASVPVSQVQWPLPGGEGAEARGVAEEFERELY